jgi:hypothetical protein
MGQIHSRADPVLWPGRQGSVRSGSTYWQSEKRLLDGKNGLLHFGSPARKLGW